MKTEAGDVTLIAVGGGAFLVPDRLAGISEVVPRPARRLPSLIASTCGL